MTSWKWIDGYIGTYKVYSCGKIYSLLTNKTLKSGTNKNGYHRIVLRNNGKSKTFYIHRLVACAFIANTQNKPCVNHIDANKNNNNALNLEWVTSLENNQHSAINNLNKSRRKLCEEQAVKIKKLLFQGVSKPEIANKFAVSVSCIEKIKKGITWKHI